MNEREKQTAAARQAFTLVSGTGSNIAEPRQSMRPASRTLTRVPAKGTLPDGTEVDLPWDPKDKPLPCETKIDLLTAWCINEHNRQRRADPSVPVWQVLHVHIPHVLCVSGHIVEAVAERLSALDWEIEPMVCTFPLHNRYYLCMRHASAEGWRW